MFVTPGSTLKESASQTMTIALKLLTRSHFAGIL